MPRNPTTGLFVRPSNSFSEPVEGTIIDEVDADTTFDAWDDAISQAMGWYQPLRIVTAAGAATVSNTEAGVAINKTVAAATTVNIPSATTRNSNGGLPVIVKDLKRDAATNNITIVPAAGTINGAANLVIADNGGWVQLVPLVDGTGYYTGPSTTNYWTRSGATITSNPYAVTIYGNGLTSSNILYVWDPGRTQGAMMSGIYGTSGIPQAGGTDTNVIHLESYFSGVAGHQYNILETTNFLSAGTGGSITAGHFTATANGTWNPAGAGFVMGVFGRADSSVGGPLWGGNTYVRADTVAPGTFFGFEIDTYLNVAGAVDHVGLAIVQEGPQGSTTPGANVGTRFINATGAYGWDYIFQIGSPSGGATTFPLRNGGYIMRVSKGADTPSINGFDLSDVTAMTTALAMPSGAAVTWATTASLIGTASQINSGVNFGAPQFIMFGSTSGQLVVKGPAIATGGTITFPNGTTDFTGTSGVVQQASAGAAFTVGPVALANLSGLGTGVATALAVNVGSAGAFVTFNGALGTPSSGTLTNATGLPVSTGIAGFGTGIATALSVNTGSAGAPVLFDGAIGTPSSGTLTNATGLPVSTGISGLGSNVATWLATPSQNNLAAAVTGNAFTTYTPTITSLTGTITTASATGRYYKLGRMLFIQIDITVTTNGTGATLLLATLPNSLTAAGAYVFSAKNNVSGNMLVGVTTAGDDHVFIGTYLNGYPVTSGDSVSISGMVETQS